MSLGVKIIGLSECCYHNYDCLAGFFKGFRQRVLATA